MPSSTLEPIATTPAAPARTAPNPIKPSRAEPRLLHLIVLLHALLIVLPYAWAALIVPSDATWGGLLYSPDDQNVHLAWARQAHDGHFFVRDLFTTENLTDGSHPLFFNALTFLIGGLSRLTALDPVFWYHALRVLASVLGLYALHSLTKRWSSDWRVRLSTVALAAFAGGAGWIGNIFPQVLASHVWIDRPDGSLILMMPEAWGFASNFLFALNAASFWLLCLAYERLLRAREGDRKALIVAAIAAFFLSNIHTYDALPLIATIALASLLQSRRGPKNWKPSLVVIGAACLPIAWQFLVFRGSSEFRLKALTPTPSPPLLDVLLSYSPLLILAVIGLVAMRQKRLQVLEAGRVWPWVWLVTTLILIYAPVSFARKMIEGVHLPLAFLAALGLVAMLEKLPQAGRRAAWVSLVAMLSLSMVNFAAWCISPRIWGDNNISRGPVMPPLYLTRGDAGALAFLNAQPESGKRGQAVLCYPKLGSYVPRATGLSVFAGHWAETLHLTGSGGKLSQMAGFYAGAISPDEARAWLKANHIGWVIEGQYESGFFNSNLSRRYPFLEQAWAEKGTKVFRVPS